MTQRMLLFSGCLALALVLGRGTDADAQVSNRTSSGLFGSRTVGGTTGVSAGTRTFSGGTRGGTTGLGPGVGGPGGTLAGATQQNEQVGTITGNERFLRGNRQGAFVGSDTADIANAQRALGSLITGGGPLGGIQGLRSNNQDVNQGLNDRGGRSGQRIVYRTSRQIGFRVNGPAAPELSATLTRRLQDSAQLLSTSPLQVQVQGRTAVLRGSVATEFDRALAAQVALLEPGIAQVDNQLVVAPAASPSPESAP